MSIINYPCYKDIYDGESPEIARLINGIPTEVVISFLCFINSEKHLNPHDVKKDIEIFKHFVGRLGKEALPLVDRLKEFGNKSILSQHDITIFPLPHILQLIEISIKNYTEGEFKEITPVEEENILKCILVKNRQEEEIHIKRFKNKTEPKDAIEHFARLIWPMMLPDSEFINRKEILIPIYQSLLFLKYLSNSEKFHKHLENYLKACEVNESEEYIRKLMEFYINGFDKNKDRFYTYYSNEAISRNPILNMFVQNINAETSTSYNKEDNNYKLLREKPILKTSHGKHFISNWNFIIDKFYEGLKRDFFERSGVKSDYNGDDKKKWGDYCGFIGEEFNEKIVFQSIVRKYLSGSEDACYFEDKSKGWNQDAYIRTSNHISLIEFKNFTFPISDNYISIKEDIDKRMYFHNDNGKRKNKAILQLIQQIKSFHENINKLEKLDEISITRNKIFIYPVIIYTDMNWGMSGVNDYLNQIFRTEIKKSDFGFFNIGDLVMIHLDFFIEYEKVFIEDKRKLHELIYSYYVTKDAYQIYLRRVYSPENAIKAFASFEFYASKFLKGKETLQHDSSLFKEIIPQLKFPKT